MNLQRISETKSKMETMMDAIYDLQEAIIEENEQKIAEISLPFRTKARELYLSLVNTSLVKSDEVKLLTTSSTFIIFEQLIEECSGYSIDYLKESAKNRNREKTQARQVHMALLHKTFKLSLSDAGLTYYKDHATVLHACKVVRDLYQTDKKFRNQYLHVFDHCVRFDISRNSTVTYDFLNEK